MSTVLTGAESLTCQVGSAQEAISVLTRYTGGGKQSGGGQTGQSGAAAQ